MLRLCKTLAAALLGFGIAGSAAASTVILDNFAAPGGQLVSTNPADGPAASLLTGLSGVIGGERYVSVTRTAGSHTVEADVGLDVDLGENLAALSSGTRTSGEFTFAWGSLIPLVGATALHENLASSHEFLVGLLDADHAFTLQMTVQDGDSSSTVTLPQAATSVFTKIAIPFGLFAGINFGDVDGLQMKITGRPALDADLTYVATAAPVPATAWAGGVMLGLLTLRRLRRIMAEG